MGLMEVAVIEARGLRDTDLFGKMDPYVLVQYKGQERKSSVAREKGSRPVWNEVVRLRAEYPGSGGDYKLILKIMDKDRFSKDDFIGEATIYLKELLASGVEQGKAEMRPSKYSVVGIDGSYCGEIKVGLAFTSGSMVADQSDAEEIGGWKESEY